MTEEEIIRDIIEHPLFLPILTGILIFFVLLYIYSALALQTIAKKLNHPTPWLSWIPIANIILMYQISGTEQWTVICYFAAIVLGVIPFIGGLLSIGASAIAVYWLWRICEKLNRPGWWSIISIVFLPAWLVMLGLLAWSDYGSSNSQTQNSIQAPIN